MKENPPTAGFQLYIGSLRREATAGSSPRPTAFDVAVSAAFGSFFKHFRKFGILCYCVFQIFGIYR